MIILNILIGENGRDLIRKCIPYFLRVNGGRNEGNLATTIHRTTQLRKVFEGFVKERENGVFKVKTSYNRLHICNRLLKTFCN